jgi:serine/threonine-protein kinase
VVDQPTPHTGGITSPVDQRAGVRAGQLVAGRYALVTLIASGGMAEVWEADDLVLQRRVAVKLLHRHLAADHGFTLRFRAEAVAAARLHHPSIVAIYDTCNGDGSEAIVMELIRGRTLRQYLDERGRLHPDEVVQIGADVADALSAAHAAGIVHRDIKPANILLCDDARVMVTDFGIAKVRDDSDLTNTGTMLGTVKYLAPEQVESSPIDGRTDIYALGVVLYEALVGRPPFHGDTDAAIALARLHQTPPPPSRSRPDLEPGLDAAVMRAMARRPADRFVTAADFRAELLAPSSPPRPDPTRDPTTVAPVPVTTPSSWGPPPPPPPPPYVPAPRPWPQTPVAARRPARRDWLLPTFLSLLIGGSILLAVALLARRDDTETPAGSVSGAVAVATATAFDPLGDGQEHDGEQANLIDGDAATAWRTETYASQDFGGRKAGVGVVLTVPASTSLRALHASSSTAGWAAEVYISADTPDRLQDWGAPVAAAGPIDGDAVFDLDGNRGRAVLLWLTALGDGPHRVEISELTLTA